MNALPALALEPDPYQQLLDLPENLVGEIIDGALYTQSRPSGPHGMSEGGIFSDAYIPFQRGSGGPGGWWILMEPELHFIRDREVLVPDVAGWRRERMPKIPSEHRFEVVPDWVCEVLSPSTARKDRLLKLAVYARFGVGFCWLVDPLARTVEVFRLVEGQWLLEGVHGGEARMRAVPFDAVEMDLSLWWVD
ncbi:MAG: Uma2 family endonuclease [Magnetococcales bacterium]|nr:Uma2 family endonuclease [Magnetococcales bacterium]